MLKVALNSPAMLVLVHLEKFVSVTPLCLRQGIISKGSAQMIGAIHVAPVKYKILC